MADAKITELTSLTDPTDADLLAIVDDPSGTPITKKVTRDNLFKLDPTPDADHQSSGIKTTLVANENQAFGDVCFINTDGEAQLADADAIATASVVVMCADASISADASGTYLLLGVARDDTWTWTVGGLVYLSTTGTSTNTLTQNAPTGTDDVIQILGVATHADRMFFNPQLVQIEHT